MAVNDMRKGQEKIQNLIDGGYAKVLVAFQKQMFNAYLKAKFTRKEALELVIRFTQGSAK